MLISLCKHWTVQITVHHIDFFVKQMNCMKILPVYSYNDDDNDLTTDLFFPL